MNFQGRASIVTGASQGIGKAIALELSKEGVEVILVDIQNEKLEEVADEIRENKGKVAVFGADVSRLDEVAEVVEAVVQSSKKIDYLVNNAGITRDNLLMRMKEEEWDSVNRSF
jgi:3-oxoacyl-[acyl-carrier protein] reductase